MNVPPADLPAPDTPAPPSSPAPARAASVPIGWLLVLLALAVGGLVLAWQSHGRLRDLEQELVRRQAASQSLASETKSQVQAQAEQLRELVAKQALAEAKLAEMSLQRAQLDELLQSFSRSRDENIVSDLDAGLRLAAQQTALFGSAEPLSVALRQADERLLRHKQARLEGVRRALQRDLERLKAVSAIDAGTLALRLDEVARQVDELPLLNEPQRQDGKANQTTQTAAAPVPQSGWQRWLAGSRAIGEQVWGEARSLLRVTRIERPEAMLLAPEQGFLLRENLKLRLLNARLALMSRQFDAARLDLQACISALERHADLRHKRTQAALTLLQQVQAQAKPVNWPRPDDSLAALAAAAGVVR